MTRRMAIAAILLGSAVCFAVALARAGSVPLGPDVSWQLYVAGALLRGAKLGRDVIEVNPPLAVWLGIPTVRLASLADSSPAGVHRALVWLLGLCSTLAMAAVGRHLAVLRRPAALAAFCLACALALALQPAYELGQREHLAILLVMPYLLLLAARLEHAHVPALLAIAVGLAAGVGFALKPFFVLPLGLGLLQLQREHRTPDALLLPETLGIATVVTCYGVAIAVAAPDWLGAAREFWPLYAAYRPATLHDVVSRQGVVLALAGIAMVAWASTRRAVDRSSRLGDALATALLGFVLAMLVQRKPWIYLAVPSGVLALALLVARAQETAGRVQTAGLRLLRAVIVVVAALRLGRYAWWLLSAPVLSVADRAALGNYTLLRAALDSLPSGTTMASLSPTHGVVFPLVLDLRAQWTMRLPSLWPAASARAQDEGSQDRLRRMVASDLDGGRPDVLLVLRPGGSYAWLGPESQRDWLQWLAQLPDGASALAPYRPWRSVGEFTVLRREPPSP
jgi:hypothetical protein